MTSPPPRTADERFAAFADTFLSEYLALEPTRSTELGDHRHDGRWPALGAEAEVKQRQWVAASLAALEALPDGELSVDNRIDKQIARTQLLAWRFWLDELQVGRRDPLYYTGLIGDGLDPLVTRSFAPPAEQLASLQQRLEGVPAIVAAARRDLDNPPELHTRTAIEQNRGLVELCEGRLQDETVPKPAAFRRAAVQAAAALREFQVFLEKDLLPRSRGELRLGRARFEKKLRFTLDEDVDIDALARDARALLERTQGEMVDTVKELAPQLWPGRPWKEPADAAARKAIVREALTRVAEERPDNRTIVADAQRWLDEATATVKKHDLVRVPDEPCRVIEMPEYRRGVAVAYCDSSGPLEAKQETFYAIAPTPKDWDARRSESFYREYNRAMLADLTVHEAMPGHYLQLMHANRSTTKLRAIFPSGSFIEGWAVYSEWLMARAGFGGARVKLQRQKMVLRLSVNALLDHGVHAGTLSEDEAMRLMRDEAFQEEGEAVGKWRRARLTSAQLSTYFHGFRAMMTLREQSASAPGFTERGYHDRLLAHGSPPPRHVPALLGAASGRPAP